MAPLTEEQLLKKRQARKEQIMEAGFKVFALRGLKGAKMSMIAAEAGLSAGQLYRFFESKEELFTTLIQLAMKESVMAMESLYQLPGSPFEKLRIFTKSVLEDKNAQYPFMLVQQAHTSDEVPEEVKQIIKQFSIKRYVDLLLPLFREGQQAGEFAEGDLQKLISAYLTVLSALITLNMPVDDDHQMPDADLLLRIVSGTKA